MEVIDFIRHSTIEGIYKEFQKVQEAKENAGFNLFTISNSISHYENFHSDIIAKLLNPIEKHNEGRTFLVSFISFLNLHHGCNINTKDFENAEVEREVGKIDIGIYDNKSKKAVIIENKINNAEDMDDQLLRYYAKYTKEWNYDVLAIIYLSLDGRKKAPLFNDDINSKVINIAVFNDKENDLANGWIRPIEKICTNDDSRSFLHQYYKLLRNLNNMAMETNTIKEFYHFVSENNSLPKIEMIKELEAQIPVYRTDVLVENIKDIKPFTRGGRWQPHHHSFEGYNDGNYTYKLDFGFYCDNGIVEFWIPELRNTETHKNMLQEKLKAINFEGNLDYDSDGDTYYKTFMLSQSSPTMEAIDKDIYNFIDSLLSHLKEEESIK